MAVGTTTRLQRIILIHVLLLAAGLIYARAAGAQDTREEFWPEIDIWLLVGPSQRLLIQVSRASGRDYFFEENFYAAYLDYLAKPTLSMRGGLGYIVGEADDGTTDVEYRGMLELTPRRRFAPGWLLTDRNRLDLRYVNGEFSGRYRNRLQAERECRIGGYTLTPYGSAELFFDSRFDAISRYTFTLGVQFPLSPKFVFELYFSRQNDRRPVSRQVNAVAIVLNVYP
jgi:hypothetical protein